MEKPTETLMYPNLSRLMNTAVNQYAPQGSLSVIISLLIPFLKIPVREVFKRIPGTADYKICQANHNLAQRLDKITANKEQQLDIGSEDFISTILRARKSDRPTKELFTSDYISSLAYEHLIAGSSSTSFILSTALCMVSKHPDADVFGSHDVVPNADDLQRKFPYVDQVIKESMRYHNSSPVIGREAAHEVELGGYVLPKGTRIWMAVDFLAATNRRRGIHILSYHLVLDRGRA